MQITAQAQFARNLARWQELLADRELARLPHRIETDRLSPGSILNISGEHPRLA
jgi:hypothetical protein